MKIEYFSFQAKISSKGFRNVVKWGFFTNLNKHKKVKKLFFTFPKKDLKLFNYLLCLGSSETDNFLLPFARRAFSTLRPLTVDILSLNPCLFFLFLLDG